MVPCGVPGFSRSQDIQLFIIEGNWSLPAQWLHFAKQGNKVFQFSLQEEYVHWSKLGLLILHLSSTQRESIWNLWPLPSLASCSWFLLA